MKTGLLVILINALIFTASSQEPIPIHISFVPVFRNIPIVLDESLFPISKPDSIKFTTLKFYISNIQFLNNAEFVYSEKNSFHLIDAGNKNTIGIFVTLPARITFNKIKFNLGIDSITNVSGVMGGDLDPTKGMYWTWQSGYINFKLEGSCSICPGRNHEFQFHLGGYQTPFNSIQSVVLNVARTNDFNIYLDLGKFIYSVDLSKQNHIMSPSYEAVNLSMELSKCFFTE